MAYLDWKEELETGINVIDGQHKRIVSYINQLHDISRGGDDSEVTEIIIALVDYTLTHFIFEETLFDDAGYREATAHIREHDAFRNTIFSYKVRASKGEDVTQSLLQLLKTWLFVHIQYEDSLYVDAISRYLEQHER